VLVSLKAIHVAAVVISGLGLLLRYPIVQAEMPIAKWRGFRVIPHGVDTLLLASAIGLLFVGRIDPLHTPWLAAKLAGLTLYIVAGALALRGPARFRTLAIVCAMAAFGYIVTVAITKQPLGPFAGVNI